MKVTELINSKSFKLENAGEQTDKLITTPFCCDLLSIAMSKTPSGAAWVTVMANINTLAVAALTDAACIILAEGVEMDDTTLDKAKEQGITVLSTQMSIYEAAKLIDKEMSK